VNLSLLHIQERKPEGNPYAPFTSWGMPLPLVWPPASALYQACKDACAAQSDRGGSERGADWRVAGGDTTCEDAMLPFARLKEALEEIYLR
jgi:hypothetical protein